MAKVDDSAVSRRPRSGYNADRRCRVQFQEVARRRGSSGRGAPPLKKLDADALALLKLLTRWRGEAERKGRKIERVVLAYEAGRDGFWLARWLKERGIEAYVIHPASVAVSREEARQTDRLDAAMLLRVLLGWLRGERGIARWWRSRAWRRRMPGGRAVSGGRWSASGRASPTASRARWSASASPASTRCCARRPRTWRSSSPRGGRPRCRPIPCAGRGETPQRDQQLARQRHDPGSSSAPGWRPRCAPGTTGQGRSASGTSGSARRAGSFHGARARCRLG